MASRRIWLDVRDVLAIHAEQIASFGGRPGVRDKALLESALMRPRNRKAYSRATVFALAAAYAFGIARNHPFVDGNKRVALVTSFAFLELNGWTVVADEADAVWTFVRLAAGELDERQLGAWLKANSRPA